MGCDANMAEGRPDEKQGEGTEKNKVLRFICALEGEMLRVKKRNTMMKRLAYLVYCI